MDPATGVADRIRNAEGSPKAHALRLFLRFSQTHIPTFNKTFKEEHEDLS
jgi:hypothetical protein